MTAIQNRFDFVYLFDVINGNPNGDPDSGNLPRQDPETNKGLVSDVCLKRKIRNYISLTKDPGDGYEIYIAEGAILNVQHMQGRTAILGKAKASKTTNKLPTDKCKARELTLWMCQQFFDVRAFGAVMTTSVNAGQVRGPVQLTFARSIEPIFPLEISITRMAATAEADKPSDQQQRTMGTKFLVPYGLYRAHGYISAPLADDTKKGTGFSDNDLEILWSALVEMFEHDRSAARGEMTARGLKIFRHNSPLGNAPAHELFDRVTIKRVLQGKEFDPDTPGAHNLPPARSFSDYIVSVNKENLPQGIDLIERI